MSEIEIAFRRFAPRAGLREEVNRLTQEAKTELPPNSEVKVVISATKDQYVVSGVARADRFYFSSEIIVTKESARGRPRLWQIEPIGLVLRDLILQARHHQIPNKTP